MFLYPDNMAEFNLIWSNVYECLSPLSPLSPRPDGAAQCRVQRWQRLLPAAPEKSRVCWCHGPKLRGKRIARRCSWEVKFKASMIQSSDSCERQISTFLCFFLRLSGGAEAGHHYTWPRAAARCRFPGSQVPLDLSSQVPVFKVPLKFNSVILGRGCKKNRV